MFVNRSVLVGSLFILLGEIFFVSMGMLVKLLSEQIPNHQLVFYRNLFAALILIPILRRQGLEKLKSRRIGMHLIRSLCGILAMYCFFYALANIELANAMILKLTGPIFIPLIAIVWINEQVTMKTIVGIAIGFTGVLIFLNPAREVQMAALVGLAGGLLAAAAKVAIRKMSNTEQTTCIVFYFALFGALFSSVPAFLGTPYLPSQEEWGLLILLGAVGTCGQFCLTQAYRIAPSSQVGPFTYSSLIWASAAGWLIWNEKPTLNAVLGASLIIAAGIVLIIRLKESQTVAG